MPNQSATSRALRAPLRTLARHARPDACNRRRRRACGGGGVISGVETPLLRFSGPFSVRWPRRVLSSERPAHRTLPLRRYPATPAPFGTNRVAKLAPAGLRSPSSECEVEVLGVADERGWASRPDRIQRGVRSSGRRPVAGSRRRDDRAVRGRPGNPVPSHSRPTQPHASAAASHPPPTPGHAPPRLVARCSATRIRRPCNARPGRTSWFFPRLVRRRSWGSVRSALRRFAPADGWCVTFPCDRARVSFMPPSSARLIFVGWPAAHGCQIRVRRVGRG